MSEEARQAEAKGESTATVQWRGHEFEVSREYDDWSVDFVESLEENKAVGIVRGALTPADWRVVKASGLKMRELSELADLIAKAMGFGSPGESEASSV
jgi:hypothetical protein